MRYERLVRRGINLAWRSLRSHLPYLAAYSGEECYRESYEIHREAVNDYAEIIFIFTRLLHARNENDKALPAEPVHHDSFTDGYVPLLSAPQPSRIFFLEKGWQARTCERVLAGIIVASVYWVINHFFPPR